MPDAMGLAGELQVDAEGQQVADSAASKRWRNEFQLTDWDKVKHKLPWW